jgi:diacylglycerol kinase (ATP)
LTAEPSPFRCRTRAQSIRCAARGLALMLRHEPNARIHLAATVVAIVLGVVLGIRREEWALVAVAIVAVWTAEALNTALELLCDVASPSFHPLVERAKDVAAGAVLVTAAGALVVGLLVFGPPLLRLV